MDHWKSEAEALIKLIRDEIRSYDNGEISQFIKDGHSLLKNKTPKEVDAINFVALQQLSSK